MRQCTSLFFIVCLLTAPVYAATTFIWNPSPDIQPLHTQYIGVGSFANDQRSATYVGITCGILQNLEVGVDLYGGTLYPFVFNAKYGILETEKIPGYVVGMSNIGTKHNVTDDNMLYALVAKTFQPICRVSVGGYYGLNEAFFPDGENDRLGAIIVLDKKITERLTISTEYASGNNFYGSWTTGVNYTFAKNVALIFGYVHYNNHSINPADDVTAQINLTF